MAQTAIAKPKKQRNYALDFWRVFATLAVFWGHSRNFWPGGKKCLAEAFFTQGNILGIFLVLTGYLMMKSYESKKRRGLTNAPARTQAVDYMKSRYLGLWPAFIVGELLGFGLEILRAFTGQESKLVMFMNGESYTIADVGLNFLTSISEFLGLDSIGVLSSLRGGTSLWNAPLWYISAIFVAGYFLYYLLAKNEDLFTGFIAPAIVAIVGGAWCLGEMNLYVRDGLLFGLVNNTLVNGIWGICLGVVCYKPYERYRQMKVEGKARVSLTILHLLMGGAIIFWMVTDSHHVIDEIFLDIWVAITLIFAVGGHDGFTKKIMDRPVFGKIGEFSLYFFICHMPVLQFCKSYISIEGTPMNFYLFLLTTLAIDCVFGAVAMFVCKKLIQPALYNFDAWVRESTEAGKVAAAAEKAA